MATVLAFQQTEEPPSARITLFCVQSYWRDRTRLARGRFEEFGSMEAALRAGKAALRRAPAVVVYRMRGCLEADVWDEPVILAALGEAAHARRDGTLEPIQR